MANMNREVKAGRRIASFVPARGKPARSRSPVYRMFARLDAWLTTHPAFRLLAIVGALVTFGATTIAAVGVMIELQDLDADRKARMEERIERNRATLFARAGGDTGKAAIFNWLIDQKAIGPSVDLSCRAIGVMNEDRCVRAPVLSGLALHGSPTPYPIDIFGPAYVLDFSDTVLNNATFNGISIRANFEKSYLAISNVTNAEVVGSMSGMNIYRSSLVGSFLSTNKHARALQDVNISGTEFRTLVASTSILGTYEVPCEDDELMAPDPSFSLRICVQRDALPAYWSVWHWADRPPVFSPDWTVQSPDDWPITICDPRNLPEALGPGERIRREEGNCKTMSRTAAILLYPLRWNPRVVCADHDDLRFLGTYRTLPPQPCQITEHY